MNLAYNRVSQHRLGKLAQNKITNYRVGANNPMLPGWEYAKKITIPATDATLTNFPVPVYLNSSNFDFSLAKADGSDIRFTDMGLNPLKFERKEHTPVRPKALQTDGVNDYASLPVISGFSGVNLTIELDYELLGVGAANGEDIFYYGNYNGNNCIEVSVNYNTGWVGMFKDNSSNTYDLEAGAEGVVKKGERARIFAVSAGDYAYIYVGKTLVASAYKANYGTGLSATNYRLLNAGMYSTSRTKYMNGKTYNAKLYNIALSQAQINDIIDNNTYPATGMLANYQPESSTTTLVDTLNGYNASLNDGASIVSATSPFAAYNVLLPTVSSASPTEFLMFYGNPDAHNASMEAWQDQTGKALTYNGNVKLAYDSGLGRRVAQFDGTGDYFSLADSYDWNFGSGDFCAEAFVKYSALPTTGQYSMIFQQRTAYQNNQAIELAVYNTSGVYRVYFSYTSNGTTAVDTSSYIITSLLSAGTLNHFAVTRSGNSLRVSLNGTILGTQTISVAIYNSTAALLIAGSNASGTYTSVFNGSIHGVRITKGRARYTANFTPPTSFDIDGSDVVLCTNFDTIYDANYAMVQHMGTSLVDASGNGNNGTATGTTVVDTVYGKARSFNGTSDWVSCPASSGQFDGVDFSIMSMIYPLSLATGKGALISKKESQADNKLLHFGIRPATSYKATLAFFNNDVDGSVVHTTGTWYSVYGTYIASSKTQNIYEEGLLTGTRVSTSHLLLTNDNILEIGRFPVAIHEYANAYFSETRISNIARSDAWIKAESLGLKNNLLTVTDR